MPQRGGQTIPKMMQRMSIQRIAQPLHIVFAHSWKAAAGIADRKQIQRVAVSVVVQRIFA